jgi:DNA polymerase (family 10)
MARHKSDNITNASAAQLLAEISDFLKLKNIAFKPQAYARAADAVGQLAEPIADIYEREGLKGLEAIPGVGKSIAEKLEEFIKTGRVQYHEELRGELPVEIEALRLVDGVGVKAIETFYKELGVRTVEDLEKVAKAGRIRTLPGFGATTEEKILKSIAFHKSRGNRFLLHEAAAWAKIVAAQIEGFPGVERVAVAGSIRRGKETIGDADILVLAKDGADIGERVTKLKETEHVYGSGETKTMVRLKNGMDLDVRIVDAASWGAALNYFTGSKEHNVHLRKRAVERGLTLNEYGLWEVKSETKSKKEKGKRVAGRTEEELYKALELAYVEPELREDIGEVDEAAKLFASGKKMPTLVKRSDLKGDLQTQSNWTDGKHSIAELVSAAKAAGLEYIAMTDHSKRLAMVHGLDAARLRKQMKEIDALNKKLSGFRVLKGIECDILRDGTLDLPDDVLAELDFVGVSVHSFFNLSRKEQTERIIRAVQHPLVDVLFHPTGRIIGRREPYDVDFEAVCKAAAAAGTALEVNGSERLDLHGEHVRMARRYGVKLTIGSDAHATPHFSFLEWAIAQARRGGAQKRDILNTLSVAELLRVRKR